MSIGILWDLDGTLLNSLGDLHSAVNYALAQFHCPARSLEEVREFVGNGAARLIQRSLPQTENAPDHREVLSVFQTYYATHSQIKTAPYPGILPALQALSATYPMAVVSNKPDRAVKDLCRTFFPGLSARGETADCPRKPAPDMVFAAMKDLGVSRCVYVGDSEVDILTAANAGVPCLSVTWGFRDVPVLKNAGATHLCHRPEDLVPAISDLVATF